VFAPGLTGLLGYGWRRRQHTAEYLGASCAGSVPDQAVRLGMLNQRDLHRVPRLRVGCRSV